MSVSVRLRAATAVGAVGLLTLTACGTVSHVASAAASQAAALPANAAAVLGLASTQVDNAGSAKLSGTVKQPGQTTTETVDGSISWGSSAELQGDISGAQGISQFSTTGQVPFAVVDGDMYLQVDAAAAAQLQGKHWMKFDFAELAAASGSSQSANAASGLQGLLKQFSPVQSIRAIAKSPGVHAVGRETMDGVATTHFTGTVTLAQLVAAQSGITAAQAQALETADASVGFTGETIDVWLDAKNLPVRVEEQASTAKGDMVIDRHFSDYGVPVNVAVPPSSDTVDLAALLKAAKQG